MGHQRCDPQAFTNSSRWVGEQGARVIVTLEGTSPCIDMYTSCGNPPLQWQLPSFWGNTNEGVEEFHFSFSFSRRQPSQGLYVDQPYPAKTNSIEEVETKAFVFEL